MAVEIPMTQGRIAIVDDIDAEWALGHKWCVTGKYPARGGTWHKTGKVWYMHREIGVRMGILEDCFLDRRIMDHINRNKFDNRRENLRIASYATNGGNRTPSNKTGFLGVYREMGWKRKRFLDLWSFEVRRHGVRHREFGFKSPEAASSAREAYVRDVLGE